MRLYSPEWDAGFRAGFREGMRERGYVEGKNLVIDMRHAEGAFARYPRYMRELLALKPDVIVAHGSSAVAAAKATSTTPIVFVAHPDPVGDGVVASLARPGGNVTGLSDLHRARSEAHRAPKADRAAGIARRGSARSDGGDLSPSCLFTSVVPPTSRPRSKR